MVVGKLASLSFKLLLTEDEGGQKEVPTNRGGKATRYQGARQQGSETIDGGVRRYFKSTKR
jgi:hypothetical protein